MKPKIIREGEKGNERRFLRYVIQRYVFCFYSRTKIFEFKKKRVLALKAGVGIRSRSKVTLIRFAILDLQKDYFLDKNAFEKILSRGKNPQRDNFICIPS